jgi:hypothetical protein
MVDTAEVLATFDSQYWRFPVITRNKYGSGTCSSSSRSEVCA